MNTPLNPLGDEFMFATSKRIDTLRDSSLQSASNLP